MKTVEIIQEMENYLHICETQGELNYKTVKAYSIDIIQFSNYLIQNQLLLDKMGLATI